MPDWLPTTARALVVLLRLPPNWDSYGAGEIEPDAVVHALALLTVTMRPDTPAPAVVPTPHGGVQLEWHTRESDLEVEITPTGRLHVAYENHLDGHEWEDELNSELDPLRRYLEELSRRG